MRNDWMKSVGTIFSPVSVADNANDIGNNSHYGSVIYVYEICRYV